MPVARAKSARQHRASVRSRGLRWCPGGHPRSRRAKRFCGRTNFSYRAKPLYEPVPTGLIPEWMLYIKIFLWLSHFHTRHTDSWKNDNCYSQYPYIISDLSTHTASMTHPTSKRSMLPVPFVGTRNPPAVVMMWGLPNASWGVSWT